MNPLDHLRMYVLAGPTTRQTPFNPRLKLYSPHRTSFLPSPKTFSNMLLSQTGEPLLQSTMIFLFFHIEKVQNRSLIKTVWKSKQPWGTHLPRIVTLQQASCSGIGSTSTHLISDRSASSDLHRAIYSLGRILRWSP